MDHARAYNGHDGHITSCCPVIFVLFLKAFRCDGHPQCHSSTVADMGQCQGQSFLASLCPKFWNSCFHYLMT